MSAYADHTRCWPLLVKRHPDIIETLLEVAKSNQTVDFSRKVRHDAYMLVVWGTNLHQLNSKVSETRPTDYGTIKENLHSIVVRTLQAEGCPPSWVLFGSSEEESGFFSTEPARLLVPREWRKEFDLDPAA
jgi:hypothetical protein